MGFGLILLWATAAFFVVYGLGFVFVPAVLGSLITGESPTSPSGMIDFRATYGGMTIAVGLILGACARRENTQSLGLWAIAVLMVCMAAGRTWGIVTDGSPNAMMIAYLVVEVVVFSLAVLGRRSL